MAPALTHLALHVRDIEACITFYQDYCDLTLVHERAAGTGRVAWLAAAGEELRFVLVLLSGGRGRDQDERDFSHLGFAVDAAENVDALAARAESDGRLLWAARQEPFPVGYYCGVRDPDGNFVEFSYGQPLGPGAEAYDEAEGA